MHHRTLIIALLTGGLAPHQAWTQSRPQFSPLIRSQGAVQAAQHQQRRIEPGDTIVALPLIPSCEDPLNKIGDTFTLFVIEYRGKGTMAAGDTLTAQVLDRVVNRPIGGFADTLPVFGAVLRAAAISRDGVSISLNARAMRETDNAFLPASRLVDVAPGTPKTVARGLARDGLTLGIAYTFGLATFFDMAGQQGVGHGPAGFVGAMLDKIRTTRSAWLNESLMCFEAPPGGSRVYFPVTQAIDLP